MHRWLARGLVAAFVLSQAACNEPSKAPASLGSTPLPEYSMKIHQVAADLGYEAVNPPRGDYLPGVMLDRERRGNDAVRYRLLEPREQDAPQRIIFPNEIIDTTDRSSGFSLLADMLPNLTTDLKASASLRGVRAIEMYVSKATVVTATTHSIESRFAALDDGTRRLLTGYPIIIESLVVSDIELTALAMDGTRLELDAASLSKDLGASVGVIRSDFNRVRATLREPVVIGVKVMNAPVTTSATSTVLLGLPKDLRDRAQRCQTICASSDVGAVVDLVGRGRDEANTMFRTPGLKAKIVDARDDIQVDIDDLRQAAQQLRDYSRQSRDREISREANALAQNFETCRKDMLKRVNQAISEYNRAWRGDNRLDPVR